MIKENITDHISELNQQSSQDILVHGNLTLVQTLIQYDLIDQYNLLAYRLLLGKGLRPDLLRHYSGGSGICMMQSVMRK